MRKRWRWLIGSFVVAIGLFVLIPKRSELDGLLQFNPKIMNYETFIVSDPTPIPTRDYTFSRETAGLRKWLSNRQDPGVFGQGQYIIEGTWLAYYDRDKLNLTVHLGSSQSWWEERWSALKVWMGIEKSTEFQIQR